MTAPEITLKNLKIAEFNSKDSVCFEATVYVDGKRFCIANDDGWGGQTNYEPLRPRGGFKDGGEAGSADAKLGDAVFAIGKRINPNALKKYPEGGRKYGGSVGEINDNYYRTGKDLTGWEVFDWFVCAALTRAQYAKDLKRLLNRRAVFIEPGGAITQTKQVSKSQFVGFVDRCKASYPEDVCLNDFTFEEALDKFMAAAESDKRPSPEA